MEEQLVARSGQKTKTDWGKEDVMQFYDFELQLLV